MAVTEPAGTSESKQTGECAARVEEVTSAAALRKLHVGVDDQTRFPVINMIVPATEG